MIRCGASSRFSALKSDFNRWYLLFCFKKTYWISYKRVESFLIGWFYICFWLILQLNTPHKPFKSSNRWGSASRNEETRRPPTSKVSFFIGPFLKWERQKKASVYLGTGNEMGSSWVECWSSQIAKWYSNRSTSQNTICNYRTYMNISTQATVQHHQTILQRRFRWFLRPSGWSGLSHYLLVVVKDRRIWESPAICQPTKGFLTWTWCTFLCCLLTCSLWC